MILKEDLLELFAKLEKKGTEGMLEKGLTESCTPTRKVTIKELDGAKAEPHPIIKKLDVQPLGRLHRKKPRRR